MDSCLRNPVQLDRKSKYSNRCPKQYYSIGKVSVIWSQNDKNWRLKINVTDVKSVILTSNFLTRQAWHYLTLMLFSDVFWLFLTNFIFLNNLRVMICSNNLNNNSHKTRSRFSEKYTFNLIKIYILNCIFLYIWARFCV